MNQSPPPLPTRFPCWCRAIYSWGGESKRDLGFVEGDLIECLNAGDGSWWTGRLRRDRRMIGLFPSNFVRVLDESFQPNARSVSPMPNGRRATGGLSPGASPAPSRGNSFLGSPQRPEKKPSKSYRKPFQAYARAGSPNPTAIAREQEEKQRARSPRPSGSLHQPPAVSGRSTPQSHAAYNATPRASRDYSGNSYQPRSHSPIPPPHQDEDSPPPPPPPHRVQYRPQAPQAPQASVSRTSPLPGHRQNGHYTSRQPSPVPTSPMPMAQTPSPLRDAMEDVMTSLHDMGLNRESATQSRSPTPPAPWCPEAFDTQYRSVRPKRSARPRSSLGIGGRDELFTDEEYAYEDVDQEAQPYSEESQDTHRPVAVLTRQPQSYQKRMPNMKRGISDELFFTTKNRGDNLSHQAPAAPPKPHQSWRPVSSLGRRGPGKGSKDSDTSLKKRKSAYDIGKDVLSRTFTVRSNTTTASSAVYSTSTHDSGSTQMTGRSVLSGESAGAFSATSAASLARRRRSPPRTGARPFSVMEGKDKDYSSSRPGTINGDGRGADDRRSGVTYHSADDYRPGASASSRPTEDTGNSTEVFASFATPKPRKSGFFKKMIESAKTGAAGARSTIATGQPTPSGLPLKSLLPNGVTSIAGGSVAPSAGGGNAGVDWVQVRRDVNRSNSLSKNERIERQERCQMMDQAVIRPVDALFELAEGDEALDGRPVRESTNFQAVNFAMVDKSTRFLTILPHTITSGTLAQGYVCRPYRSDAQRLRAIFTWVSEKIAWEEDFEAEVDTRRVIQTKRGCAEEIAVLVLEMCSAVGIEAEVVRGYLKAPGEIFEGSGIPHPNHRWNAVVVDGEWRIMDCCLASPTNPKRSSYSNASSQVAESWWCLCRPMEICYTHVPLLPEQQHICPPLPYDILFALPCACPTYFKDNLNLVDYDTSLIHSEELELVQLHVVAPADMECVAEVETKAFERDADGDYFESGELVRKRALSQADWIGGEKRYTIKALLPGDEGQGILKIYAGKRGLMHSIKDNPYPLAFALPIIHTGTNLPYDFLVRHPTPHAQRHDLYVVQPQCARLAVNNTFVFAVRQHPSSGASISSEDDARSTMSSIRPGSAMSMATSMTSSSTGTGGGTVARHSKPAKLAIQAPSGKIMRLMRKSDHTMSTTGSGGGEAGDGGLWETIIKCGERGVWRCLVLADRSARWCVFAEWTCI